MDFLKGDLGCKNKVLVLSYRWMCYLLAFKLKGCHIKPRAAINNRVRGTSFSVFSNTLWKEAFLFLEFINHFITFENWLHFECITGSFAPLLRVFWMNNLLINTTCCMLDWFTTKRQTRKGSLNLIKEIDNNVAVNNEF